MTHSSLATTDTIFSANNLMMGHQRQPFKCEEDIVQVKIDGKLVEFEMEDQIEHVVKDEPQFSLLEHFFAGKHIW